MKEDNMIFFDDTELELLERLTLFFIRNKQLFQLTVGHTEKGKPTFQFVTPTHDISLINGSLQIVDHLIRVDTNAGDFPTKVIDIELLDDKEFNKLLDTFI